MLLLFYRLELSEVHFAKPIDIMSDVSFHQSGRVVVRRRSCSHVKWARFVLHVNPTPGISDIVFWHEDEAFFLVGFSFKFRLKNCGLRKPIYLVEEHGASDRHSIPQATLFQATVNTQVYHLL